MRIVKDVSPPKGLRRLVFRAPLHAYHARLGWLFGRRLLLLHHTGRVTGKPREVILEVVEHDARDGSYVVASGWGPTAAWYRNVMRTPQVRIQVGSKTIPVTAVPLPAEQGADILRPLRGTAPPAGQAPAASADGFRGGRLGRGLSRRRTADAVRAVRAALTARGTTPGLCGVVRCSPGGQGPLAAPPAARVRIYDWTRSLGDDGVPRTTGADTGEVRRVGKDRDDRRRWCG